MITILRTIGRALLYDEMAVRRWLRAILVGFATGGMGFADQLAALLAQPGHVRTIKIVAVISGFLGVMINLGDKNPKLPEAKP